MNKIYWLTGQSGAGKTTVARRLQKEFNCVILDGDEMRDSISLGAGFSREERREHNYRVARLAKVLSEQHIVLVTVIAPMEDVRAEIDKICAPTWIYIKRTMPEREGHFYEEPDGYFTIDHNTLNVEQSVSELKKFMGIADGKAYSLFIGRYQPLHAGHHKLIQTCIDEGNNVLIGLRDTPLSDTDPYSIVERTAMFQEAFGDKVKVIPLPDIKEVVYGRKVGWGIRQIQLDAETESISATKIREQQKNE